MMDGQSLYLSLFILQPGSPCGYREWSKFQMSEHCKVSWGLALRGTTTCYTSIKCSSRKTGHILGGCSCQRLRPMFSSNCHIMGQLKPNRPSTEASTDVWIPSVFFGFCSECLRSQMLATVLNSLNDFKLDSPLFCWFILGWGSFCSM